MGHISLHWTISTAIANFIIIVKYFNKIANKYLFFIFMGHISLLLPISTAMAHFIIIVKYFNKIANKNLFFYFYGTHQFTLADFNCYGPLYNHRKIF